MRDDYLVVDDNDKRLAGSENGKTVNGKAIMVRRSSEDEETGEHEIGHTAGAVHNNSNKSVMYPASTGRKGDQLLASDILDMISFPLKGKVNSEYKDGQSSFAGKGTVTNETGCMDMNSTAGQTDKDLKKGKVQATQQN